MATSMRAFSKGALGVAVGVAGLLGGLVPDLSAPTHAQTATTTMPTASSVSAPTATPSNPAVAPPPSPVAPPSDAQWSEQGCTAPACHQGIEPIRAWTSNMMQALLDWGRQHGDRDGCIGCHGGDPRATEAATAHRGSPTSLAADGGPDAFFADPASPWINDRTCGHCHEELVEAQWRSLMMTEAGKIQGTTWSFGSREGYQHRWANYDVANPSDPDARLGTRAYRAYMDQKAKAHPNVFVSSHETMPLAPQGNELAADPGLAANTYIRTECQRCHLGVKGRQRRGDFRGMGCGACHIPYSNEGRYEGADQTLRGHDNPGGPQRPDTVLGRPLVHRIQGTRDAPVQVGAISYSGIPVETCSTCHNRGKRIGVSYQGLMESAYGSPYTEGGGGQLGLHSKHYLAMEQDVHFKAGMLCQDCHTSGDVHGDNFLAGANLGAVEIECSDCHGTPQAYPWELPLGWGDENAPGMAQGPARGTATAVPEHLEKGFLPPARDGYLLSARGNPMPDVVREGDHVIVHTAGGKDLALRPLRALTDNDELTDAGRVAMVQTDHVESMECYACHATWAPQCYGCHIKVDYASDKLGFDWVQAGHKHLSAAGRTAPHELDFATMVRGEVTETRSYLRWEDPALGINGEGRVTPIIPGCQTSATIIGEDGKEVVRNHIFRTAPGTEGGGEVGQLGIDMSPVQPHTITKKSRSCTSCHDSAKALGYGIAGGDLSPPWSQGRVVDLQTATGEVIPQAARPQIEPIAGLEDWSAVVTPDGQQLQTVGHHFDGSGPLPPEMRAKMDRRNVCLGCHMEIPERSLAVSLLHHIAKATGKTPATRDEHESLITKILLSSAWLQAGGLAGLTGLVVLSLGYVGWRRRKSKADHEADDAPSR